ncbi:MAG: membrane protein insertion efficiency factor YidD [Sphingobacteriaceae bacterium]|nr:membrane protein insertion efficiency factor YidD [Sphingobacteriaceae bacterium]
MNRYVIILFFFLTSLLKGQSDLNRLLNANHTDSTLASKRKINYVFKGKNWFVKYNPLSLVFGGALFFYQGVISPQIMQGCAFEPSCSAFSKACIHEFGLIKGISLSTDRLTRCTRLSSIDFHPVLFNNNNKVNDIPEYYRLRSKK